MLNWVAALAASDPCIRTISGNVRDSLSKDFVPYVIITVDGNNKGTYSDEKGHFHLDSLCPGTYTIIFKSLGYKTISTTINTEKTAKLTVYLSQQNIELKEVNIEAYKSRSEILQTQASLHGKELNQTRGLSLAESLAGITGVSMIRTGPSISKPVIHGMYSNRVLIINNGVRQEGQQWGSEHAPEIDPFIASELTVIKGAASIRYGSDAMGGVILVAPKPLKKQHGYSAELNLVGLTNNRQGVVSGIFDGNLRQVEGLAFRLQGTYKKAGSSFAPGYNLGNTGFQEINFSSAVRFNRANYEVGAFYSRFNTTLGILRKSHIGNKTDLLNQFESNRNDTSEFSYKIERPRQDISHDLLKVYGNLYGDYGKLNLTYAFQHNYRAEYDAHRPYKNQLGEKPNLEFNLYTNTLDFQWEHSISERLKGSAGIMGMIQANVYTGRKLIPNFTNYTGGIYLIEKYTKDKFQLEGGVRYDYKFLKSYENLGDSISSNNFNWSKTSGSIGASLDLSDDLKLQATLGTAWRAPSINELFIDGVHHGAASYEKGDRTLKEEMEYSFTSHLHYYGERIHGEIGFYYNLIDHYIYLKPDTSVILTILGAYPSFHYTQVNATYFGLDSDLTIGITNKLNLDSKITLVRAENRETNQFLEYIPADKFIHSLTYSLPDFSILEDVELSLTNISVLRSKAPKDTDHLPPPPGYSVFNADLSFSIPVNGTPVSLGIGFNNILNTKYRDYLNRFRYFSDETGRNFIIRAKIPIEISN